MKPSISEFAFRNSRFFIDGLLSLVVLVQVRHGSDELGDFDGKSRCKWIGINSGLR